MKAIDILSTVTSNVTKGSVYKNFELVEGKLNPRSTYFYTFRKAVMTPYNPDAILISPCGEKIYFYKIEH